MRAIAVLAVVFYHAGLPFLPGGYVGVDIFFVISGFLITSHLVGALNRDGHVGLASFYARRIRRILPASVFVLLMTLMAAFIWIPPQLMRDVWRGAVATALYIPNLYFAATGTDYLAEVTPSVFQHYWSLGIEEQFYLVWPLLLIFGWKFVKSKKNFVYVIVALVIISFVAGAIATSWRQPWAFFLLPFRAWELGLGGVVALVLKWRPDIIGPKLAILLGWLGVGAMILPIFVFSDRTVFPGYWAALPAVGSALVVLVGGTGGKGAPGQVLSSPTLGVIGTISYSLYLIHWPALTIPQIAVGYSHPIPLWINLSIAIACVPLSWLVYRLIEDPMRSASFWRKARPRRTLMSAGFIAIFSIAIASGFYGYTMSRPLHDDRTVQATEVSTYPVGTAYVPQNMKPTLKNVSNDLSPVSKDGCHRSPSETSLEGCVYGDPKGGRVVLFGDSHAAQWYPALHPYAASRGYAVESRTKSACPSISATTVFEGNVYHNCDEWRDAVIERINQEEPTLVVLSNFGGLDLKSGGDKGKAWEAALVETIQRIDAPVVVIGDTPSMGETPALCLSKNLHDTQKCSVKRAKALSSPTRKAEREAVAAAGAAYIDLTDLLCNEKTCDPIIGNTLVYRDDNHLTATFSALLAPALGRELDGVLERRY